MNKFVKMKGLYVNLNQIEGWSEIKHTPSEMPYFDIYLNSGRTFCIDLIDGASLYIDFFNCLKTYNENPDDLNLLTIL